MLATRKISNLPTFSFIYYLSISFLFYQNINILTPFYKCYSMKGTPPQAIIKKESAWNRPAPCFWNDNDWKIYNSLTFSNSTVGENIIATTKIRNIYGAIQSLILNFSLLLLVKLSLLILFAAFLVLVLCFFFDGPLSKVIALPTIAIAIVVALSRS